MNSRCSFNRLSIRLYNRLYTRYSRFVKPVTGLTTGRMFVYTIRPVAKPVCQPVVSCKRGLSHQHVTNTGQHSRLALPQSTSLHTGHLRHHQHLTCNQCSLMPVTDAQETCTRNCYQFLAPNRTCSVRYQNLVPEKKSM